MRKLLATLALGGALAFGAPNAAEAQDSLVDVTIGDITIQDVNVTVAAQIAAAICVQFLNDVNLALLAVQQVDEGNTTIRCDIGRSKQDLVIENN